MTSAEPSSSREEGDGGRRQGGRGRGSRGRASSPRRRHWAGRGDGVRGGRGGRGRGRGRRGDDESSAARRGAGEHRAFDSDSSDEAVPKGAPQDEMECNVNHTMTALLKKKLRIGNDYDDRIEICAEVKDTNAKEDTAPVITATAAAAAARARAKAAFELSKQQQQHKQHENKDKEDSRPTRAKRSQKRDGKRIRAHQGGKGNVHQDRHQHDDVVALSELVTDIPRPAPDRHYVDTSAARSKHPDKKFPRRRPNRSNKNTSDQQEIQNVCNHGATNPTTKLKITPSKTAVEDTDMSRSKPKLKKASATSARKGNDLPESFKVTASSPSNDDVFDTSAATNVDNIVKTNKKEGSIYSTQRREKGIKNMNKPNKSKESSESSASSATKPDVKDADTTVDEQSAPKFKHKKITMNSTVNEATSNHESRPEFVDKNAPAKDPTNATASSQECKDYREQSFSSLDEATASLTTSSSEQIVGANTDYCDDAPCQLDEDDEMERINRLLREAREKSAAAKEKKKSRKTKKHEKWLEEKEVEKSKRAKVWYGKVSKEKETIELISQLIVSEILRQNKAASPSLTKEQVWNDSHASQVLANESKTANESLYGGIECHRVKVAGLDRQDLNGRQGTLRYWDSDKEMFCVGLDTKKSAGSDEHFLMPENLEAMSAPRSSKANKVTSYNVEIKDIYNRGGEGGIGCHFTFDKSVITSLKEATSVDVGLEAFCLERDEMDHRLYLKAEEERRKYEEDRRQEELDRKRRAELRAKEMAERERAKEERRRKKEEEARMQYEWMNHGSFERAKEAFEELERLRMLLLISRFAREGLSPYEIYDIMVEEGFGPNVIGIDYEDFCFRWFGADEEYEKQLQEEEEEKVKEMAKILEVEPDADGRTLKVAYRKLALKFHPDKWRSDSDHGLTQDESLENFKNIQNAYDHLMSRFDSDDE